MGSLGLQQFLPLTQFLLVLKPEVVGSYLLGTGTLGWGPRVRLGLLTPEISLLNFYPPHMDVVPAHSTSLPLLAAWIDLVSLFP